MATSKQPRKRAARKPQVVLPADHELAVDTEEKLTKWLIDQRIPRSRITMVAGRPGQGKSLFTAWLAGHVSQQKGEAVVFSNIEDIRGEDSRPRIRVAGADLKNIHFWTPDLATADGLQQTENFVKALGITLMVIDPLAAHLPRGISESRDHTAKITELCSNTGLALVAVHHTRVSASKKGHAIDAVLGTGSGFKANARAVYLFGRNVDDPDERILSAAKINGAEEGSMTFNFDLAETEIEGVTTEIPRLVLVDPMSDVPPHKILEDGTNESKKEGDPVKRAVAGEWLTSLLMFGELHKDVIRKKADEDGLAWRTIRRAADGLELVQREAGRGFGKGKDYFWSLPKDHPALKVGKAAVKAGVEIDESGQMTVEDVLAAIDAAGTVDNPNEHDEEEDDES